MLVMKIFEGFKTLINNVLYNILREGLVISSFENISEAASIHIFNEYPESILEIISIVVLYNVVMIANRHQCYFISD
jgi:hypothetical protein